MNLKEAFRFQNKLESLIKSCLHQLTRNDNLMQETNTYLRKKVMMGAEDETVVETPDTEYAGRVNELTEFVMYLLSEKEKLCTAIHDAKAALPMDMDSQIALNVNRQSIAQVLKGMSELRSSEQVEHNGGFGYRFNTDGNQVTYKCDVRRVKTINYDRNRVRALLAKLNKTADEISTEVDRCLVTYEVNYAAPFDVNDGFIDILDTFAQTAG